ncbi:MAG: VanW family protein [Clostridia bacterium]|nr:VanW family protein [Clostridia bacterium]
MRKLKHSAPHKKGVIIGGAVILALAVGLIGITFMGLTKDGGKITASVSVLGNTMTELTREELTSAVQAVADQNPLKDEIKVTFLDNEHSFSLDDIGAEYDVEAIADKAYEAGSMSLWNRLFGNDSETIEIPVSIKYDEAKLDAAVKQAAVNLSRSATEFSYEITEEGVEVVKGDEAANVSSSDISERLIPKLEEMDFSQIDLPSDAGHAEIDFEALKAEIDREVQNPMLDLENDPSGNTILPAQQGIEMKVEDAKKAYEQSGDSDTFLIPVTFTEPTMSMEEFQKNLFAHTLSSITSSFNPSLKGRTTNVKLACDHCNNIILNPGDEFSYNKAVGPRTYERGFKDATVYVSGTTEDGVGGGICQVSSTIYSAALHADLKITERYNHSYMITYVPLGEDATVVYGSKDFRFVNDTDYPIKIKVSYGSNSMTVKLIGTNLTGKKVEISTKTLSKTPFEVVYKTDETLEVDTQKVKNNGYTGYTTESYRLVYENGKLVSNTFENKSVYKKLDKLILENPSSPEKSGNYVPPETPPATEPTTPTTPTTPSTPEPSTPVTPTPEPSTPAPEPVTPVPDTPLPMVPDTPITPDD